MEFSFSALESIECIMEYTGLSFGVIESNILATLTGGGLDVTFESPDRVRTFYLDGLNIIQVKVLINKKGRSDV